MHYHPHHFHHHQNIPCCQFPASEFIRLVEKSERRGWGTLGESLEKDTNPKLAHSCPPTYWDIHSSHYHSLSLSQNLYRLRHIHPTPHSAVMRLPQSPPTLISLLSVILSCSHIANAKPYPRDDILGELPSKLELERRACANPCGWSGQLCCGAGQTCFTDVAGQAQCGTSGSGGSQQQTNIGASWQLYTTTFIETDLVTRTSVYSSYLGGAQPTVVVAPTIQQLPVVTAAPCSSALNEIPCGGICCAAGQYCQFQGQCAAVAGGGADFSASYFNSIQNTGSAFLRPTSNGVRTVTSTGTPTTTVAFSAPTSRGSTQGMAATATNNGLSGGAIAGIVIGVLLGLALLLLLCGFYCFRTLFDGILAIFGLGPKRRRVETTEYIETHHSSHGGAAGGRTWWGRPARVDRPSAPKRSGGLGGFGAIAAALGGLALILGLKRGRDRREKSSYGSGSYSDDYYTSASEYPIPFLHSIFCCTLRPLPFY